MSLWTGSMLGTGAMDSSPATSRNAGRSFSLRNV